MELWIRSQDKKKLLKVKDGLFIANGFDDTDDSFIGIKNVGHVGRYKTEKRALEVLDEIHKLLNPKPIISTYNVEQAKLLDGTVFIEPMLDDIKMESYTTYVYQMPEE